LVASIDFEFLLYKDEVKKGCREPCGLQDLGESRRTLIVGELTKVPFIGTVLGF